METKKTRGFHYGWVILAAGILVVAAALGLARFGYSIILPSMQQDLGLSHEQTGIIASANMLGYAVSALIAGLLAGRFGPRAVVAVALLWTGLTMLATGFVDSPLTAAFTRLLTGIGSAGANVPVMGLASAWFAPNRRGLATGFLVGGAGLAIAFTGWTVPYVNSVFNGVGWRYNWMILGASAILVGIAAWIALRNSPSEKGLRPLGETGDAVTRAPRPVNAPGVKDILSIRGVPSLTAMYFCFGFSYIIAAMFWVTFLVEEVKCTEALAGSVWGAIGILSIGSGVLWGVLSDRIGRKWVLFTVFSIQAACYLLLLSRAQAGPLLWLPAVLFGMTAWSIPGLAASCCGDLGDARKAPAVLGFITLVMSLGQVLGPAAAGFIKQYTMSFSGAFIMAALVAVLGAYFSSRLNIPVPRGRKEKG